MKQSYSHCPSRVKKSLTSPPPGVISPPLQQRMPSVKQGRRHPFDKLGGNESSLDTSPAPPSAEDTDACNEGRTSCKKPRGRRKAQGSRRALKPQTHSASGSRARCARSTTMVASGCMILCGAALVAVTNISGDSVDQSVLRTLILQASPPLLPPRASPLPAKPLPPPPPPPPMPSPPFPSTPPRLPPSAPPSMPCSPPNKPPTNPPPVPPPMADVLNERFTQGHPSNNLAEAGLFIIAFSQTFSFPEDRWNFYGQHNHVKADHASGSIVNPGQPWSMCDLACGAFVIDPAFVAKSLVCAYPEDGATTGRDNFGCPQWNHAAYPPNHLKDALQKQRDLLRSRHCTFGRGWINSCYNEVILRADGPLGWYNNLPDAIQAVIFSSFRAQRWSDAACRGCEKSTTPEQLRTEHSRLLERFGVNSQHIPLLYFDWDALDAPFTLAAPPPSPPLPLPPLPSAPWTSPLPAPPALPHKVDAAHINARFHRPPWSAAWHANGALADAGILFHVWDNWEYQGPQNDPGFVYYKARRRKQMSASMIFADQQPDCCRGIAIPLFTRGPFGLQGLIFRPGTSTRILCGSGRDTSGAWCDSNKHCPSAPLEGDMDRFDPHHANGPDGCGITRNQSAARTHRATIVAVRLRSSLLRRLDALAHECLSSRAVVRWGHVQARRFGSLAAAE